MQTIGVRTRLVMALLAAGAMACGVACSTGGGSSVGAGSPLPDCPGTGSALDQQACSMPNETCATFATPGGSADGCCTCSTDPSCSRPTWVCLGGSSQPGCPAHPPSEGTPCSNPTQSGVCVYCSSTPSLVGCRETADGGASWTTYPVGGCLVGVDAG